MTIILILQYLLSNLGFLGSGPTNLMKCCYTIDESLPHCLDGSGGSDVPSPISAAGSGGLRLALPGGGG